VTKPPDKFIHCITCGVPMRDAADHADGDLTRPHCRGCVRPDGSIITYDEVCEHMAEHLVQTLDLHPTAARTIAEERLSNLPAWSAKPPAE